MSFFDIKLFNGVIDLSDILQLDHTIHWDTERFQREQVVLDLMEENEHIMKSFLVDKGHKNGKEIHCVTSSGLIFILNEKRFINKEKNPLITILIARKGQLTRLYHSCHLYVPEFLMRIAGEHQRQHLNYA